MTSGIISRADLLRALSEPPADRARIASLLGYDEIIAPEKPRNAPAAQADQPDREPKKAPPRIRQTALEPVPFWYPESFQARIIRPESQQTTDTVWRNRPTAPPVFQLLAPWRELLPRLRHALTTGKPGAEVDIDKVVDAFGQGRYLDRVPMELQRGWPDELHIIIDRSDRLTPFWDDQDYLTAALTTFRDARGWRTLQLAGMQQDFSWARSAKEYVKIYRRALTEGSRLKA